MESRLFKKCIPATRLWQARIWGTIVFNMWGDESSG